MPIYNINYITVNTYEPSLREAVLEFLILPAVTPVQKVNDVTIQCQPQTSFFYSKNLYDFDTIRCRLKRNIPEFMLSMSAIVEKQEMNPFPQEFLPVTEEREMLNSKELLMEHYYFLQPGPFTTPAGNWFPTRINEGEQVFDFAQKVNELVHFSMAYDLEHASVKNSLEDVLGSCKGVCQDYAHLMIAILRENRIPARYVSGYLNQGADYEGSGAIHAWVEVFIPGTGWTGFDPTNNLVEDHHYLKISHGIDFSECTSIKGIIKSKGDNTTNYEVRIKEMQTNSSDQ